jgi:DNA-binding MarR family transcriptional regulator
MNSQADGLLRQEFGITYSQFVFLMITSEHPGIDVTRLAGELGVTKGAVSKRISWFIDRSYAYSKQPPGNSKRVCVYLTPQGLALAQNAGQFLENTFLTTIVKSPTNDYEKLSSELSHILDLLIARRAKHEQLSSS